VQTQTIDITADKWLTDQLTNQRTTFGRAYKRMSKIAIFKLQTSVGYHKTGTVGWFFTLKTRASLVLICSNVICNQ